MTFIKLNSPSVKACYVSPRINIYCIQKTINLSAPTQLPAADYFEINLSRRSRREFNRLPLKDLSALLWYSYHTKQMLHSNDQVIQFRPTPSAGATHSMDLLVIRPSKQGWKAYLYDPISHALCSLKVSMDLLEEFMISIDSVLSVKNATVIWMVSQVSKVSAKYENPESLIWRDAGALLGILSMSAEALNLALCPLGITGENEVARMLTSDNYIMPLGGCLVGTRTC